MGISVSSIRVSIDPVSNEISVQFIDYNAVNEFNAAVGLSPEKLQMMGAASVTSASPATTTPEPPEVEEFPLAIIVAGGSGCLLLAVIMLLVWKKIQSEKQGDGMKGDQRNNERELQHRQRQYDGGYADGPILQIHSPYNNHSPSPREYAGDPML